MTHDYEPGPVQPVDAAQRAAEHARRAGGNPVMEATRAAYFTALDLGLDPVAEAEMAGRAAGGGDEAIERGIRAAKDIHLGA